MTKYRIPKNINLKVTEIEFNLIIEALTQLINHSDPNDRKSELYLEVYDDLKQQERDQ